MGKGKKRTLTPKGRPWVLEATVNKKKKISYHTKPKAQRLARELRQIGIPAKATKGTRM